jgi:teichuronic acid biosynthesis glycosyltransferase TuaC
MKVVIVSTDYPHRNQPMAGLFIRTQAEALARNGVTPDVIAPVPWVPPGMRNMSAKWKMYHATPESYRLNGIQVYRPRYLQYPRGDHWAQPHRAYMRCISRYAGSSTNLIHAHFAYPTGAAAVKWARKHHVPCVLSLRGDDVNSAPYVNRLCRRRFVTACREADTLLAVSRALAAHTERLTGVRPRVLLTGVNPDMFKDLPDKHTARNDLQLHPGDPVILFVGLLAREKGAGDFISAVKTLSKDRVTGVLVGDGPLRPETESVPNIRVTGFCDHATVLKYMKAADVLVLPTYNEGMPSVLVEAGWTGVPVIASAVGGVPELLGDNGGLLIEPGKPEQIVRAVRTVLLDPDSARQRSAELFETVRKEYDAIRNASELVRIYQHTQETAERKTGLPGRDGKVWK